MSAPADPHGRRAPTPDPAPVRLVCLDVDGTLVGASGAVHPAVWDAVARARAAGLRLAVCSGRPGFGVTRALAERVDADGWHGFQNGASVLHLATGASRSDGLPAATVAMLVDRARAAGRAVELYADADYVVERDGERERRRAGLLGLPYAPRPFDALAGAPVRAQWLLGHDETPAVLAEPHPGLEVTPSLAPTMPDSVFVNLTRAGVDKGTAVRAIAAAYDVPLAAVMFVGDGLNDAPAMRLVGWPVAMADAEPAPRALARHVVADADAGGAAAALTLALDGAR